jgi:hypothetical protein
MVSNLRKNFSCIVWHQKPTVHHITACPPGFKNLTTSLNSVNVLEELNNYYNAKYAPEPPVQQHGALPSGLPESDPPELEFDAIYRPN